MPSEIPYVEAGKFDGVDNGFNAIRGSVMRLGTGATPDETTQQAVADILQGINDLQKNIVDLLRSTDKRLHNLENFKS